MGKVIKKQLNGMSWWMKTSLILLLTLSTSVFMYQGWYKPVDVQAAVAPSAWTFVESSAPGVISGTYNTTATYTALAGSNRLLLVAVAAEVSAVASMPTLSASYGGVSLSLVNATSASATARSHMYVGYLKESQIPAGAQTISVSYAASTGTVSGLDVAVATYTGVDQTTPINGSSASNAAAATVSNTTAVSYVLDGLTFTAATNGGTALTNAAFSGAPAITTSLVNQSAQQFISTGNSPAHTSASSYASSAIAVTFTGTTSTRTALVVGSLRPAAAAAGGTLAVSTATQTVAEAVGNATISVTRTGGTTGAVTVDYATADGTALAGQDYTSTTGTLSWAAGDATAKTITVPIINDTYDEATETFTVTLTNATNGATLGTALQTISITDDDTTPTIGFSAASSSGSKNTTPAAITVTLSAASGLSTSVNYTTVNGTAVAGTDYTTTSGTLTIPALSSSGTINVPILPAGTGGKSFTVTLNTPTNSTLGTSTHTFTITTAAASTITTCGGCHGHPDGPNALIDSATRTGGSFQGSHEKHVSVAADCAICHVNPTTLNHSTGTINFNASINGGTYSGGTAVAVSNAVSRTFTTTCSGTSCHANVYAATAGTSPAWGTPSGCGACHTAFPITASGPATGAHATHAAAGKACTACHTAGTTATTVPSTLHANGSININIPSYPVTTKHAANSGYTGTCTTIYCHSNGTGGTTQSGDVRPIGAPKTVPTWGLSLGCNDCHGGVATDGRPEYQGGGTGGSATNKMNEHQKTKHLSKTCDFCHDSVTYNAGTYTLDPLLHNNQVYNIKAAMGYTYAAGGGSCATSGCHGLAQWGVTVLDCITCHSAAVDIAAGPLVGQQRAAVAASLKSSGTVNHKGTALNTDANKWDCVVCHLEGVYTTGSPDATLHGNGVIDFRDPDTGLQVKKVNWTGTGAAGAYVDTLVNYTTSRFTRNLAVTLENDPQWLRVASVQQNLCLKCHDTNGATNTTSWTKNAAGTVVGTALRPFGQAVGSTSTLVWVGPSLQQAAANTVGAVMNVNSQLLKTNAAYHPVVGKGNNGYTAGTRMKAPWNAATLPTAKVARTNTVYGWLISCFDCHNTSAGVATGTVVSHGNQTAVATPTMRANPYTTAATVAAPNLCTTCHADAYATTTSGHGTGSGLTSGPSNMGTATWGQCRLCHGALNNTPATRAVQAHGASGVEASGAATWQPYSFIRGSQWTSWSPGSCANTCTTNSYTPGGVY